MELMDELPVPVRECEAAETHTLWLIELHAIAKMPKHVAHLERALEHLCDSVPSRLH